MQYNRCYQNHCQLQQFLLNEEVFSMDPDVLNLSRLYLTHEVKSIQFNGLENKYPFIKLNVNNLPKFRLMYLYQKRTLVMSLYFGIPNAVPPEHLNFQDLRVFLFHYSSNKVCVNFSIDLNSRFSLCDSIVGINV